MTTTILPQLYSRAPHPQFISYSPTRYLNTIHLQQNAPNLPAVISEERVINHDAEISIHPPSTHQSITPTPPKYFINSRQYDTIRPLLSSLLQNQSKTQRNRSTGASQLYNTSLKCGSWPPLLSYTDYTPNYENPKSIPKTKTPL